jgi:hypothetical protein
LCQVDRIPFLRAMEKLASMLGAFAVWVENWARHKVMLDQHLVLAAHMWLEVVGPVLVVI